MAIREVVYRGFLRLGYDVRRLDTPTALGDTLAALIRQYEVQHAVDVGANEGQFVDLLRREARFSGRIDSFEPVSSTFSLLADRLGNDPLWFGHRAAATESTGDVEMDIYPSSLFNSMSRATQEGSDVFARIHSAPFEPVRREQAPGVPLDQAGLPDVGRLLLKVDTQGHDWPVIQGAAELMDRVDVLVLELSFERFYDSSTRAWESLRRLDDLGFGLVSLHPICRASDGRTLGEADGVFARRAPA